MNPEKMQRMEELVREISRASHAYYVLDDPYISDMQWDRLYDELKALEQETSKRKQALYCRTVPPGKSEGRR